MLSVLIYVTQHDAQPLISRTGINQSDILERNQQVLLMKKIYSKAERVIGWLGSDENGGSQALKTFETLLSNTIRYPDTLEWVRKMPELFTVNTSYGKDSSKTSESNDRLEKLVLFLGRPFWRRIWTVQEMVLQFNLRLLCGEEFTDIPKPDSFNKAIGMLSKLPTSLPKSVSIELWMRLNWCIAPLRLLARLRCRHLHPGHQVDLPSKGTLGFMYARPLLEFHKTSDPRDHVYGLLGLMELDIAPDYGEDVTTADVYLELARHCLKTESRKIEPLGILSLAGTQNCNGPDRLTHLDMPSWVPDWRLPTPARIRVQRYPRSHAFPSNGGFRMQVIDHKWIQGSAVVWDRVSRTEHKTGWDLTEWDLAERIDIEKPGDLAYPSGTSRFTAIVVLRAGGYDGSKTTVCDLELDSELFRSYETMFFAHIMNPWANINGRKEIPKLSHLIFGAKGPASVPMNHRQSYVARSRQLMAGMRCFHTEKGYIGLGPLDTEVGDVVCVLEGHKAPVLLRRRDSHYVLVGDCDVVGIMNGEILDAVKRRDAEITIIEIR